MTYVYKDDIGFELLVTVGSLTSAVAAYLDVKKPISKTTVNWVCAASGYDSSTLYYITSSSSNGWFDEAGWWTIQPRVIYGAASSISLHGDSTQLLIYEPV